MIIFYYLPHILIQQKMFKKIRSSKIYCEFFVYENVS